MRASLRCGAIPESRRLRLQRRHFSHSSLSSGLHPLDFHGQIPGTNAPRSCNLTRSPRILDVAHSCATRDRNPQATRSVSPNSKPDTTHAPQRLLGPLFPHTPLLDSCVQTGVREPRRSPGMRHIVLVERDTTWVLRGVLFSM